MHVAFVTKALAWGGAERALQRLLSHSEAAGIDPVVLCPENDVMLPWLKANGIRAIPCDLPHRSKWHLIQWFLAVRRLRKILREEKVDLIHANHPFCYQAVSCAAKPLGIPRLCVHMNEISEIDLRWTFQYGIEGFITISRYISEELQQQWPADLPTPKEKYLILPAEVPPDRTPDQVRDCQKRALRHFQVPDDMPILGFIGALKPVKGLKELLIALSILTDRPWRLLIAGGDPLPEKPCENECKQLIRSLELSNRVQWLGFQDNTSTFYDAIDCVVVPSLFEPLGLIPLEAAVHYKPSIISKVGGLTENVKNEKTGWHATPGDISSLRQTLAQALSQPSFQPYGIAARAFIAPRVAIDHHLHELKAFYEALIPGSSPREPYKPFNSDMLKC